MTTVLPSSGHALDTAPNGKCPQRALVEDGACPMDSVSAALSSLDLLHLLEHAGLLLCALDANGCILWLNAAASAAFRLSPEEARGRDWSALVAGEADRETLRRACRPERVGEGGAAEQTVLLPGEAERFIRWEFTELSQEGKPPGTVLCLGQEVTELQRLRHALEACEERGRSVLETAVNAIVIISEDGIIQTVNSATARLFGYTKEEMLGKNISMLMPSPHRERHDAYLANYRQTGCSKIIGVGREAVAQRKDGTIFPVDLSVGEARLRGGKIYTGIIRDITERKRLEQQMLEISEKEQQRIGQDIHDDLCQQLAAVSCLAQVVQQRLKRISPQDAQSLAEIVRLVSQANTQAREMARGLVPVVVESHGLMSALKELVSSTEKVFRVTCRFHCERPVMIEDNLSAIQLYRIAQESVGNAIRHGRATRIDVALGKEGDLYVLAVRDNGVGIPEQGVARGSGIGLITMAHRAKILGGRLTVAPDALGGTVVTCEVPLHAPKNER